MKYSLVIYKRFELPIVDLSHQRSFGRYHLASSATRDGMINGPETLSAVGDVNFNQELMTPDA